LSLSFQCSVFSVQFSVFSFQLRSTRFGDVQAVVINLGYSLGSRPGTHGVFPGPTVALRVMTLPRNNRKAISWQADQSVVSPVASKPFYILIPIPKTQEVPSRP
jgi:hypothetical protein